MKIFSLMPTIAVIQADNQGAKLVLKDLEREGDRLFLKYKATWNDVPWQRTEVFVVDGRVVITGDDGTVLYRFGMEWLEKIEG